MTRDQLELIFLHLGPVGMLMCASKENLMNVDGVGEKVADTIIEYFSHRSNRERIYRMAAAGVNMHTPDSLRTVLAIVDNRQADHGKI